MHWINSHGIECLILYWVFSAAVSPMPEPNPAGSAFYRWFYGFAHGILQLVAANWTRLPGAANLLKGGPPSTENAKPNELLK
jgi:hypothetical protein